jgi:hypothetical protein
MDRFRQGGATRVVEYMKCYYCNKDAITVNIYTDNVDGVIYDYPHCIDHENINDHTQEAIDLWKAHQDELWASQTTFE